MKQTRTYNGYVEPLCKVLEVNIHGLLCQSGDTEKFTLGSNNYDDDDWD